MSQTQFLRLLITVTTVIIFYLPISVIILIINLLPPRQPYSWTRVHGYQWGVVTFLERPRVGWDRWIGPMSSINLFSLIGITKASKKIFELVVEWTFDNLPRSLQRKLLWMRNVSAKCKQSRLAGASDAELRDGAV